MANENASVSLLSLAMTDTIPRFHLLNTDADTTACLVDSVRNERPFKIMCEVRVPNECSREAVKEGIRMQKGTRALVRLLNGVWVLLKPLHSQFPTYGCRTISDVRTCDDTIRGSEPCKCWSWVMHMDRGVDPSVFNAFPQTIKEVLLLASFHVLMWLNPSPEMKRELPTWETCAAIVRPGWMVAATRTEDDCNAALIETPSCPPLVIDVNDIAAYVSSDAVVMVPA